MEKERIRIDSGVREIEVNDNGDRICIPMNDNAFFKRVNGFLDWVDKEQAALGTRLKSGAETDGGALDAIDMQIKLSEEICAELDKLFGEGCCRKVFAGVQSPSIVLIWDFLEQLMPILQKFAGERNEKINFKYNRNRRGANTKR